MDKNLTRQGLTENQLLGGFENSKQLEYDDGVIAQLGSDDEIIRYGMLVPYSEDSQYLSFIIYGIQQGHDITESESSFLDKIDSRFIGHSQKKDLTKREILCLFLNQYWDWSKLEWLNDRNVSVLPKEMFSAYSQFCSEFKFDRNTRRLKYSEFSDYMLKYGNLKRTQEKHNGEKLNNYVIANLPAYKESLTKIPSFDLSKHTELKQA